MSLTIVEIVYADEFILNVVTAGPFLNTDQVFFYNRVKFCRQFNLFKEIAIWWWKRCFCV